MPDAEGSERTSSAVTLNLLLRCPQPSCVVCGRGFADGEQANFRVVTLYYRRSPVAMLELMHLSCSDTYRERLVSLSAVEGRGLMADGRSSL